MKQCTQDEFLKDVSEHKMAVLLDNDVHRCITFGREGGNSWLNRFTITTWPGYLAISGDMGSFVFSRLHDMFQFFRTAPEGREGLYINKSYWHEKMEAEDRRTGSEEYDEERFKEAVKSDFDQHEFDSEEDAAECWERIQEEVLGAENEYEAHRNASEFSEYGFTFADFWEHDLKSYTYQFVWCCYAIAWAIKQYDTATKLEQKRVGPQ